MRTAGPWAARAAALDDADELAPFRARFRHPEPPEGVDEVAYLTGHSLGLQPVAVEEKLQRELRDWARLGVRGHMEARAPWYSYHERFRAPLARLAGAMPSEVVAMNGLTVNLHLLMVSFYRPTPERRAILVEAPTFASDRYVVETQIRTHGGDPGRDRIEVQPDEPGGTISTAHLVEQIERHGSRTALVLISGVSFLTGQRFDLRAVVKAAHAQGCVVGFDLAHAMGNVPVDLHDTGADFAAWCSYKYLNAGPGAVAGAFVHERHHASDLPRWGGWWGNDPSTRFKLQLEPDFVPVSSADGWQLSNPPVLALAPLEASLELFDEAGLDRLRAKAVRLTGFLETVVSELPGPPVQVLTPADPEARGCQLSLRFGADAPALQRALEQAGVVTDFRAPDVIRVAPVPLYNRFADVARFGAAILRARTESGASTETGASTGYGA